MPSEPSISAGTSSDVSVAPSPGPAPDASGYGGHGRARRFWVSAALTVAVATAFTAGRLSTAGRASRPSRPQPTATSAALAGSVAPVPPANRITYFLVGSQGQADTVRQVLREQAEQAAATGAEVVPFEVVVMETPAEQQAFEEDINECESLPDCIARLGNAVDLRPYR